MHKTHYDGKKLQTYFKWKKIFLNVSQIGLKQPGKAFSYKEKTMLTSFRIRIKVEIFDKLPWSVLNFTHNNSNLPRDLSLNPAITCLLFSNDI